MSARRKRLNCTSQIMAVGALLAALLIPVPGQAQLNWASIEQYQNDARLLHYNANSTPVGTLLIWPEFKQTHRWLPIAHEWQQRGWQVLLLQPDARQQQFDPASEQVSAQQSQWLKQLAAKLTQRLPKQPLPSEKPSEQEAAESKAPKEKRPTPLVVIAQGSAALWYQQLVDGGGIERPQALILFDALPRESSEQQMLAISLARSPYPILDIYSHPDNPLAWHNQQRRQQQLNRREKTGYAVQYFNGPIVLNKQIAGWLVRLGWLPLPPSAPHYLKEQHREFGISRPRNPATTGAPASP